MTTPSIPSVQALNEEKLNPVPYVVTDGAVFNYVKDTETCLVTRIELHFNDIKMFCDIQNEVPSLFNSSLALLFGYNLRCTNKEGKTYTLIKSFVDSKENKTKSLNTHVLRQRELNDLLILIINKINEEIKTFKGMRLVYNDLLVGNFDFIKNFIRGHCLSIFYSLLDNRQLRMAGTADDYVPSLTPEEFDDLNKVIHMYTHFFCNMFDNFLTVALPVCYDWRIRIYGATDTVCIEHKLK